MEIAGYNLNDPRDCGEALAVNDRFIRRYMDLVDRYGKLPACAEIISEQTKDEFPRPYREYLASLPGLTYLVPPGDPSILNLDDDNQQQQQQPGTPNPDGFNPEEMPPEKLDELFSSLDKLSKDAPVMQQLERSGRALVGVIVRQIIDWSNICSVALEKKSARIGGLQAAVLFGHLLGTINSGMYFVMDFQPRMTVALAQQGLEDIRRINQILAEILEAEPMLSTIIKGRIESMDEVGRMIQEHIDLCNKQRKDTESF